MKTTRGGRSSRSRKASESIESLAPGMSSARARSPVAMTTASASTSRPSERRSVSGPVNAAVPRKTPIPAASRSSSVSASTGSVKAFLKAAVFAQLIDSSPTSPVPAACSRCTACSTAAAWTYGFLASQPRLGQVPPRSRDSTTSTRSPRSRPSYAAV